MAPLRLVPLQRSEALHRFSVWLVATLSGLSRRISTKNRLSMSKLDV
jgi:hypothetical protein